MKVDIIPYERSMAAELALAYDHIVRDVPHCYPVKVDDFASAVSCLVEEGQSHERLHSEEAVVARNGLSPLGFIHVGIEHPEGPGETQQGIIRFFWYERGRRRAGQALLDTAEDYFRQHDVTQVTAFHQRYRYPFYHLNHAYLSDRLGQVHALLGFRGYQRVAGEVFLDWPGYTPVTPSPAEVTAEVSMEWRQGHGTRPGLTVHACVAGEEVGVCACISGGESSGAADAQDWVFTEWIGVAERMRGKGLGRHLLQRTLQEMHGIGYRHAVISTAWRNYRGLLFYSNFGYHVVDWTYGLQTRNLK